MAYAKGLDGKVYKDKDGNKFHTTDFDNLPYELWNSTTVLSYLDWLNLNKYGKVPEKRNMQQTRAFIKRDLQTYGTAVIKEFLRRAVQNYKGNMAYPTLSYPQAFLLFKDKLMDEAIEYTVITRASTSETDLEAIEW